MYFPLFVGVLCVVFFVIHYFVSILVLQSSWRDSWLLCRCIVTINVLTVPWVGLQYVIVVFPDLTLLLFVKIMSIRKFSLEFYFRKKTLKTCSHYEIATLAWFTYISIGLSVFAISRRFYFGETPHPQSFAKIKTSQNIPNLQLVICSISEWLLASVMVILDNQSIVINFVEMFTIMILNICLWRKRNGDFGKPYFVWLYVLVLMKVIKRTKIRNRYNQAPNPTQDINGKVTTSQLDITNESQDVSPFPAGDHKTSKNRRALEHNKTKQNKTEIT